VGLADPDLPDEAPRAAVSVDGVAVVALLPVLENAVAARFLVTAGDHICFVALIRGRGTVLVMGSRERPRLFSVAILAMLAGGCSGAGSGEDADAGVPEVRDPSMLEVPEARVDLAGDPPADAVDIFPDPEERPPDCMEEHPQNLSRLSVSIHGDGWLELDIVSGRWRGARSEGEGSVVSIEGAAGDVAEILSDLPLGVCPVITESPRIRWALFPGALNTVCSMESDLNLIVLDESGEVLLFAVLACVTLYNLMDLGNVSVRREPRPICIEYGYMNCKFYGRNHIVVGSGGPETWVEPGTTFELGAGPHVYDVTHRHASDRYYGEFGGDPDWEWCADEEGDVFSFSVVRR
jgi:hypothetical protein